MTPNSTRSIAGRVGVAAATSALALAAAAIPSSGPSAAAEPSSEPVDQALRDALIDHPAPVGTSENVTIDPTDGSSSVQLLDGTRAEVILPFEDPEPAGHKLDAHTPLFIDETTGLTAAVQPLTTNGVRMILTMDSPDAPTEFEFDLGADAPVVLSTSSNGGVQVSDRSGGDIGFIAPPWAQDASGRPVATHYEIRGSRLVQVVDHAGAAYPVVADPSFQGDCGYVTCTVRLNRAKTLEASRKSGLLGATAALCGYAGPAAVPCAIAVTAEAAWISAAASEYYDDGDCLKIKITPGAINAWPERLKHGDYNCTDK